MNESKEGAKKKTPKRDRVQVTHRCFVDRILLIKIRESSFFFLCVCVWLVFDSIGLSACSGIFSLSLRLLFGGPEIAEYFMRVTSSVDIRRRYQKEKVDTNMIIYCCPLLEPECFPLTYSPLRRQDDRGYFSFLFRLIGQLANSLKTKIEMRRRRRRMG